MTDGECDSSIHAHSWSAECSEGDGVKAGCGSADDPGVYDSVDCDGVSEDEAVCGRSVEAGDY